MIFNFPAFIHLIFIGFIALFPVINPLGSAFIVSPYFSGLNRQERLNAIKRISLYAFSICLFTLIIGHWILQLFGITIPIIQLAGGILICKTGWEFLSPQKQDPTEVIPTDAQYLSHELENKLFFPITFPITTGAGTIAVLFTLSAHGASKNISQYLINNSAIMIAVSALCVLVFICYLNANRLIQYLGSQREKIINSIMAFLIFCVGLQIAVEGITQLILQIIKALHQAN
ncbi:MarC family protein [Kaistella jeonii]|uniref:MarC family protein n=1 Tax=Kaistella jeonii TaxID=266749 RepID=UPI00068FE579|nr:MarC family protein [Kaistella jeonii]SFC40758.1 multiple antibiotic resistance protein [Kaistella jeonii]VEI97392.1 inner membrane protein [Kaistella jeonii]